jgi:hypothetical protein
MPGNMIEIRLDTDINTWIAFISGEPVASSKTISELLCYLAHQAFHIEQIINESINN